MECFQRLPSVFSIECELWTAPFQSISAPISLMVVVTLDAPDGGSIETQKIAHKHHGNKIHDMFMSMFFVRMVYKCTKSSGVKNEDSVYAVVSFHVVL